MDSIRIRNLHCLKDTGLFNLKPINILVGANSSGKSTFLRTFPLLKQGLSTNKKGPILWLSEDVDFGDFKEAVKRGEDSIEFEFVYGIYHLEFHIKSGSSLDYINYISISFNDQKIEFFSNVKGIEKLVINGENLYDDNLHIRFFQIRGGILPEIFFAVEAESFDGKQERRSYFGRRSASFENKVIELINDIVANKLSSNTVVSIKDRICSSTTSKANVLSLCQNILTPKTWSNIVNSWTIDSDKFITLNNYIVLLHSVRLLRLLNEYLSRDLFGTAYIGPIRATAERYYRRQNFALDYIDSRGINLPMFINDLSSIELRELRQWLLDNFEFAIHTEYSGGHITISLIDEKTKESFNLADSGFGFSQILPIIVSIWLFQRKRRFSGRTQSNSSFVIEQPELHLHPALQAKLADIFIKTVKYSQENDINLKLIIETHSETIINRIGSAISNGDFDENMVTVGLFSKEQNSKGENVTFANYTKEGYLENWPIGFFDVL